MRAVQSAAYIAWTLARMSTQPSTLRGTVKWVSAYVLSNNNKWRWCLRMVAADRRTHSPNRLVWSEGWRPPGAQSAFTKWTGWTLAMTMSWWQHHKHCPGYYYLFIIIIYCKITIREIAFPNTLTIPLWLFISDSSSLQQTSAPFQSTAKCQLNFKISFH